MYIRIYIYIYVYIKKNDDDEASRRYQTAQKQDYTMLTYPTYDFARRRNCQASNSIFILSSFPAAFTACFRISVAHSSRGRPTRRTEVNSRRFTLSGSRMLARTGSPPPRRATLSKYNNCCWSSLLVACLERALS